MPVTTPRTVTAGLASPTRTTVTDTARSYSGTGSRVAFIVGSDTGLIDLGLLDNVSLVLLNDGNIVDGGTVNNVLSLSLLGTSGNRQAIVTRTNATFDAVQLRFDSVLTALTSYNLYSACVAPAIDN